MFRWCVLDFALFYSALTKPDIKNENVYIWAEIVPVIDLFKKLRKEKIPIGLQSSLIKLMEDRIKQGKTFLPPNTKNYPIFLTPTESVMPIVSTQSFSHTIRIKYQHTDIFGGFVSADDHVMQPGKIYISTDGVLQPNCDTYQYSSVEDLHSKINLFRITKKFTLDNWANISLHKGKAGLSDDPKFRILYSMFSPIKDCPTLFGHTGLDKWVRSITGDPNINIEVRNSEYYNVKIHFDLPVDVDGINTTDMNIGDVWVMGNKAFVDGVNEGKPLKDLYLDLFHTTGLSLDGFGLTQALQLVCLGLISKCKVSITELIPCIPISLTTEYHRLCNAMRENMHKSFFVAGKKGSGKSTAIAICKEKGYFAIDSDIYGAILYCLKTGECIVDYKSDNGKIELATFILNFIKSNEGKDVVSLHEVMAEDFCKINAITLKTLLTTETSLATFRSFANWLAKWEDSLLPYGMFVNICGLIPSIMVDRKTFAVPTLVVFSHSSLYNFPSMSNMNILIGTVFDTVIAVVTRNRGSPKVVQVFLLLYYISVEPNQSREFPAALFIKALKNVSCKCLACIGSPDDSQV